jgi:hypothetical protein
VSYCDDESVITVSYCDDESVNFLL